MAESSAIVVQMVFCILAVTLLLLVARDQHRRGVRDDAAKRARQSFVLWWLVLATFYFEQFLFNASRFVMEWNATGLVAIGVFEAAFLVAAFGLLLDHLAYIVRGDQRLRRVIIGYYVVLFVLIAVVAPLTGPYTIVDEGMGPSIDGDVPAFGVAVVLLLMLPIFVTIGTMMRLFWHAPEGVVRYRIGMLVVAILFFLLALGTQGTIPRDLIWTNGEASTVLLGGGIIVEGILPLFGAWAAFRAYHPAAWVQVKLGLLHDAHHPEVAPLPPLERV